MVTNNAERANNDKNESNENEANNNSSSATTVLAPGTVESRGIGTKASSREEVSAEITAFLNGEGKLGWASEIRAFLTIWIFITRLPAPLWVDLHPGHLMRGMVYFPIVGSLIGVFVGAFFDLASAVFGLPSIVAAAFCTGASFWVTGCFHEDGLADTSDGFGGGWSRQQILRIMTDTRLGTYGCAVLMLYIVAKLELLAALGASHWNIMSLEEESSSRGAGPALLISHALARLTAPYLIRTRDYVEEVGPKSKYYSFMVQAKYLVTWYRVIFASVFCMAVVILLMNAFSAIILIGAVLFLAQVAGGYGTRVIGGVMGDYLGATICITELLVLTILLVLQNNTDETNIYQWFQGITVALISGYSNNSNDNSNPILLQSVLNDKRFFAFLRFFGVILLTGLWSKIFAYPSFEQESTSTGDKDSDDSKKEEASSNSINTDTIDTPRMTAETVCSSPASSFEERFAAVKVYLDALAKPVGSLGTLEDWAARVAALQRTTKPKIDSVACLIFAADHGVAASPEDGGEGCSAFPQAVTQAVLVGLERSIAGASVLAECNNVKLRVVDVGVKNGKNEESDHPIVKVSKDKLPRGTKNFAADATGAMTAELSEQCIRMGRQALEEYVISETKSQAVALGEVGIGNTTSSSALIAALTSATPEEVCGGGAQASHEVDSAVVSKKVDIVKKALTLHGQSTTNPAVALAKLGGAEIAAMVGVILEASDRDIPVLIDGFIVTAAALVAVSMSPNASRVLFMSSHSAEKGQRKAIEKMLQIAKENGISIQQDPILSMNLRMGEGTAALLAVPILRSAVAVVCNMGTIQDILGPPQA